jgi:mono/diheme cytochrome c family protein
VRIAPALAGGLVLAAAVLAAVAFTSGGDGAGRSAVAGSASAAADTPGSQARAGLAVWVAQGCGSCHTLAAANAHGTFGPDLASSLAGTPAASIRRSIVAPNAESAAGYTAGMMPDDFASRIAPRDLDRLVAFLRVSAR